MQIGPLYIIENCSDLSCFRNVQFCNISKNIFFFSILRYLLKHSLFIYMSAKPFFEALVESGLPLVYIEHWLYQLKLY